MISLSAGTDVRKLIERVIDRPERFADVTICSPYIDNDMPELLARLIRSARRAQCGVRIITSRAAAESIQGQFAFHPATWRDLLVTPQGLHAKVYTAIARRTMESEAIITSANLTAAGTRSNVELGVRAAPTSEQGLRLIAGTQSFIRRLTSY
jgi:hypothetical protein